MNIRCFFLGAWSIVIASGSYPLISIDEEHTSSPRTSSTVHEEDNLECTICLSDIIVDNETQAIPSDWLSCSHARFFHHDCLHAALERRGICPVCKAPTRNPAYLQHIYRQYRTLCDAIVAGDLEAVEAILSVDPQSLNRRYHHKKTALMYAAATKDLIILNRLITAGAGLNAYDDTGKSVMFCAVYPYIYASPEAHVQTVRLLLDARAPLQEHAVGGESLLCVAAHHSVPEIIDLLVTAGADPQCSDKFGRTPLLLACSTGNMPMVHRLLALCHDHINTSNQNHITPLLAATNKNYEEIALLLLKHKADPAMLDNNAQSVLLLAVEKGHQQLVTHLLAQSCTHLNTVSITGNYPLYSALINNHETIVDTLLAHKPKLDIRTVIGATILDAAILSNNPTLVARIISLVPSLVTQPNQRGFTPIYVAAETGNKEIIALLLEHKSDLNDSLMQTTPLLTAAGKGHEDAALILLEHNADPTVLDEHNQSVLLLATAHNNHRLITQLLAHTYPHMDTQSRNGNTPLYTALKHNLEDIVDMLMRYNPQLDVFTENGDTLIHPAVLSNKVTLVKRMVEQAPYLIPIPNKLGFIPLFFAAERGNKEIVSLLIEHKSPVDYATYEKATPLIAALINNHNDIALLLLEQGADANQQASFFSELYSSPLNHALALRNYDLAHTMIETYHADVNAPGAGQHFLTLLIRAIKNQDPEMVDFLIAHGADPNQSDGNNRTPLKHAITLPYDVIQPIIESLLHAGANPHHQDSQGSTPLFFALHANHECPLFIAQLFHAHSPRLDIKDNQGKTALMHAVEKGLVETVRWLLDQPTVSIRDTDNDGCTALVLLMKNWFYYPDQTIPLLKLMLEHDAQAAYVCDHSGANALDHAARSHQVELYELFHSYGIREKNDKE